MLYPILALLVLVATGSAFSHHVCYVKPNNSSVSCPDQPCLTIDQYTSHPTEYFTAGSDFLFLAGKHIAHTPAILQNISDVVFRPKEKNSNVTILCMMRFTIQCKDVTNLTIEGLTFTLYGDNSTRQFSILSISNSKEVFLRNLRFQGTFGINNRFVRAAHCIHSNITMLSCLFKGNTGYRGGAILATGKSNLTLGGNVFTENKAVHYGGAIFVSKSTLHLNALGNIFRFNSVGHAGGALFCLSCTISLNDNSTHSSHNDDDAVPNAIFESNSAENNSGGAIGCVDGNLHFAARVLFANNFAGGDGGAIVAHNSALNFSGTAINISNNVADHQGGGVAVNSSVFIIATKEVNLLNNYAGIDGGAFDIAYSSLIITSEVMNVVNNSVYDHVGGGFSVYQSFMDAKPTKALNLINNHAYFQGGGIACTLSKCTIMMATFIHNSAYVGGGFACEGHSDCNIISADFINNTGEGGAIAADESNILLHQKIKVLGNSGSAVFAADSNVSFSGDIKVIKNTGNLGGGIRVVQCSLTLVGTILFESNKANSNISGSDGGAIYMFKSHSFIAGIVLFENNSAVENGGALSVSGASQITVSGNVTFVSNMAESGGAMHFENGATMTVKLNTSIVTSNNYAIKQGGAIYHTDAITASQCKFARSEDESDANVVSELPTCFILLEMQVLQNGSRPPWSIASSNDSAGIAGGFLYGGLLDKCSISFTLRTSNMLMLGWETLISMLFEYQVLSVKTRNNAVSSPLASEPFVLCFCESNQIFQCADVKSVVAYRGRKFTVPLLALSQGDTVSQTQLRAEMSSTARLKSDQTVQTLPQNCTDMPYSLYSSEEQEVLIIYPDGGSCHDIGRAQAAVNVKFLPCPDAFILSGDYCTCEERLQEYGAECTIFDEDFFITIKADSKFWVNALYSNGTYEGLVLSGTCPIGYCKTESVNISINEPDNQCDEDRSGLLCGACAGNYSFALGSSRCQDCSSIYLILLLLFAVAGIVLVVFISILRMTVATGLLNSVILYANIVQANRDLLFPSSMNTNVLTVFIAWMNLDFGFQTCFYNGMDAHAQTWLQFAFPLYVWVLISLIIFASRYSMRVTKLIGSNPIAVLATLLLMSYTKILKVIIDVYSPVRLYYPGNKTLTMWLRDANLPYLQSWHLLLAVVTTLVLVLFFLPYTVLLLLAYKLYRFPRRWYFYWLIKIKPLLESYYAPYKPHTRFWTGFLLLVRCPLYVLFSFNSVGVRYKSLLAINITLATLAIALLLIKVYTHRHNNFVEALVYLNLIVLSASALSGVNSPAVVNSLVGVVFLIMMGIIVYHFHIFHLAKFWPKIRKKLRRGRAGNELEKLIETAENEQAEEATEQLHHFPQNSVVTTSVIEL